jgi:hypothetical protein
LGIAPVHYQSRLFQHLHVTRCAALTDTQHLHNFADAMRVTVGKQPDRGKSRWLGQSGKNCENHEAPLSCAYAHKLDGRTLTQINLRTT